MKYKKCGLCSQIKQIEYFYNKAKSPDGKNARCKHCVNKSVKAYQKLHTKETNIRQNLRNSKIRIDVINKYGNRCSCCGESNIEFLAIDHINGGGNKERKDKKLSSSKFYGLLYRTEKREDLRVLCHNCNMSLGMYGYCPHKDE